MRRKVESQEKSGIALTSDERINADPLAKTIVSMISAMEADYGAVFSRQFNDPNDTQHEVLKNFKRRLYQKLRGLPLNAIIDGYELCTSNNTKFCPTIPEIVGAVLEVTKQQKKQQENIAEQERLLALPDQITKAQPERIAEMLKQAMHVPDTDHQEWLRRKEKAAKDNEALVSADKMTGKIKTKYATSQHGCAHSFCLGFGSMSHGTRGENNYYCAEHFMKTM